MATVKLNITDQMRADQLTTAMEGGSNDWYFIPEHESAKINAFANEPNIPFVEKMWNYIKAGNSVEVWDIEDDELLGHIDLKSIEEGEQLMADKYPKAFTDMYLEQGDAETADIWFQLAVMKEVTYN